MTTSFKQKQVLFIISAALVAATFVAYEPIRHNKFVGFDDRVYITENPHITGPITQQSITWAFTSSHAMNWHPITWLSHMIDCQLFGLNPLWHHLVSVLFHITNALLIFWILTNLTGSIWASAFTAAVFALHPLQVESVAWAAERKTVLAGFFWFLTIAVYIWYTKKPTTARFRLLFGIYALCIMTKPAVVTLPFVLLLLDYWPLGRLEWGRRLENKEGLKTESFRELLMEKAPLFVLSAVLCVITVSAQKQGGAVVTLEKIPLFYRIANMFTSYISYIDKMIWPSRLAVLYPHPRTNLQMYLAAACALLFILASILAIYIGRRRKYAAMGWLWFVGTLVPMVGLVQAGVQAMADRYMYVSMIGLLIIVAWAVKDLVADRPRLRIVAAVSAAAVLSSAIMVTRAQVGFWENGITLFEHTVNVTKNNSIAEINYGCALFEDGRLDEAVMHLSNAIRINPASFSAQNNLGKVIARQGKLDEAIACFNELLLQKEDSAEVHYNLAVVLSIQGKYNDAIKHFARVLELNPRHPDAHNRMAATLLAAKRPDEAIAHLNEAMRERNDWPGMHEMHYELGQAYEQKGDLSLAEINYRKALTLKPDYEAARNNLSLLLSKQGKPAEPPKTRTNSQ